MAIRAQQRRLGSATVSAQAIQTFKQQDTMKKKPAPPTVFPGPAEDEIRDYAYHLYVQSGSVPGRDLDNWLEARACLGACIPRARSQARLHHHLQRTQVKPSAAPTPEAKNLVA